MRTTRMRADTTVAPADVAYPTDSGLLARAVGRIAAAGRRIQAAGGAVRTKDGTARGRRVGGRGEIGAKLRLRPRRAARGAGGGRRVTGELAGLAAQPPPRG